MRRRSMFRLCLTAGVFLLAGQLTLLALLLYSDDSHAVPTVNDMERFINITSTLQLPVILIDSFVLTKFISARQIHNENDGACVLCDIGHPIAFGALYKLVAEQQEALISQMEASGFTTIMLLNTLPTEPAVPKIIRDVPVALMFRRTPGPAIHLVLFHEREADFWWYGAALSDFSLNQKLQSVGVSKVEELNIMQTEGALDKFEGETVKIDGITLVVPVNIPLFLSIRLDSSFVECMHSRAAAFHEQYGRDEGKDALKFKHKAWKLLARAKKLLDELGIPFWLSSGTCLGFFRECDIITYSKDVDLGIMASNYHESIIPLFTKHGLALKHWFGQLNDSLELSFVSGELKLDLFFFYEEEAHFWNGGTQAKSGLKFKYLFPKFSLCWTEFLDLKVRVPCDTLSYIQANYGPTWDTPTQEWDWKSSPPNVRPNGAWPKQDWPQVIKLY